MRVSRRQDGPHSLGGRTEKSKARRRSDARRAKRSRDAFPGGGDITIIHADGTTEVQPGAEHGGHVKRQKRGGKR